MASGDPETHSVILRTRIESGKPSVSLRYEAAADADFRRVVASGEAETGPARD